MASDNHAHYARIGFTVVLGVAAIAATLVYLGGFHDKNRELLVETFYDHPVSGLSVGSPVNFRGVKIGEVRAITFAADAYAGDNLSREDMQRVCMLMAVDKRMLGLERADEREISALVESRVKSGLRATVASSGITGLSRIELNIPENPPPCARLGWTPQHPLVPPAPSLFESFSDAAAKMMAKLKQADFAGVWSNVQSTARSTASLAENVDALVDSQRASVSQIMRDVGEASASLRTLSETLKENPSLLLRPSDPQPLPETAR